MSSKHLALRPLLVFAAVLVSGLQSSLAGTDPVHPCDILDRQVAELLLGGATRERGASGRPQTDGDQTTTACLYWGAGRDRSGGRIPFALLAVYEYTSRNAAATTFATVRTRKKEGGVAERPYSGLGDAAYLWNDQYEIALVALKGTRLVELRVVGETMENRSILEQEVVRLSRRAVPALAPQ